MRTYLTLNRYLILRLKTAPSLKIHWLLGFWSHGSSSQQDLWKLYLDLLYKKKNKFSHIYEQIRSVRDPWWRTTKAFHTFFVITHTTAATRNTPWTCTHPSNPAGTRPEWRQCRIVGQVSRFSFVFFFCIQTHIERWYRRYTHSIRGKSPSVSKLNYFHHHQQQRQSVALACVIIAAFHANELVLQVKLLVNYLSKLTMALLALTSGEMDGKCALETTQD